VDFVVVVVGFTITGSLISGSVTTILFSETISDSSHKDSKLVSITGSNNSSTSSLSKPKDFAVSCVVVTTFSLSSLAHCLSINR